MAYKVLGQSAPGATTATDMYTVPSAKETIISTLAVCNRTQGEIKYRIAIRPAGATLANTHYISFDAPAAGQDTTFITVGLTMATTDVLTVYAAANGLTFSAYGTEMDV
jgi:hypothetical protein